MYEPMTSAAVATLATFAASYAVLRVGHDAADHIFAQTDHIADHKGAPSREELASGAKKAHDGWAACLAHVALYHAVMVATIVLVDLLLPTPWTWAGLAVAMAWSAVTHAIIDRRWPVRWVLEHTGSPDFAKLAGGGMNGPYLADQALHHIALLGSALAMALV